jgi:hypothetical protein
VILIQRRPRGRLMMSLAAPAGLTGTGACTGGDFPLSARWSWESGRERGESISEIETPTSVSETSFHPEMLSAATTSIEWIRDFAQPPLQRWSSHKVDRVLALNDRGRRVPSSSTPRGDDPDITFGLLAGACDSW